MRIEHPAQQEIPGLRRLWKQAFGDTEEFLDLFFAVAYAPERSLCAVEGNTVAAALYWLDGTCRGRPVAYLYAVATEEKFRGRGLCRTLLGETERILKDRGYAGAVLVPGEAGLFSLYHKLGFQICSSVTEWQASASTPAVSLTELGASEYAARRRKLLPEGAVVQEGPALELLEGMARFYAGDGLLAAAVREENTLRVLELLGDPSRASGIVAALGADRGWFRGPGTGKPFAMYRGFDDAPAPAYLGFALD